jgi:hypothetical protein
MDTDEYLEVLYRVDERTERIDERVGRLASSFHALETDVDRQISEFERDLDKLDERVQRNSTIINIMTFGIGSLLTAVLTWLHQLNPFK